MVQYVTLALVALLLLIQLPLVWHVRRISRTLPSMWLGPRDDCKRRPDRPEFRLRDDRHGADR